MPYYRSKSCDVGPSVCLSQVGKEIHTQRLKASVVCVVTFQIEMSKTQFQQGSLKFLASSSSRVTTDNFNQSLHLQSAAPLHVDSSTTSPERFLERDVVSRYSADWLARGDMEDGAQDNWMSSHQSTEHMQLAQGPLLDVPFRGELILHSRYKGKCGSRFLYNTIQYNTMNISRVP